MALWLKFEVYLNMTFSLKDCCLIQCQNLECFSRQFWREYQAWAFYHVHGIIHFGITIKFTSCFTNTYEDLIHELDNLSW